jgi:hypothetical protein
MLPASTRRPRAVPLVLLLAFCFAPAGLSGCAGGEEVTARSLREARQRWEQAGVRDYDLEWASSGLNQSRYVVAVRGGRVRTVEAVGPDGARHEQKPAEPDYFGVDGLFKVIADELKQLDSTAPFGQPKGSRAVLRFTPDPTYGYPRNYRRDVVGAPMALAIDVLRFTPDPGRSPRPGER